MTRIQGYGSMVESLSISRRVRWLCRTTLSRIICSANGNTSFTFLILSSSLRRSNSIPSLSFFMDRLIENSATILLSSYLYFFKARSTFRNFLGSSRRYLPISTFNSLKSSIVCLSTLMSIIVPASFRVCEYCTYRMK